MAAREKTSDSVPHAPLHLMLILATIGTLYPILWVVTIACSGKQSLSIIDLPPDPTAWDRIRAIIPWPAVWSLSNFTSVMRDQPFARWILNSAIVAIATTVVGVFLACTAAY